MLFIYYIIKLYNIQCQVIMEIIANIQDRKNVVI